MPNTENPSTTHTELDAYPLDQLVAALANDQRGAFDAVLGAQAEIVAAVAQAAPRMRAGGRLVYVGAGTSGRLAVLDSVELLPTFSWPPERALALLAGGRGAMFEAIEGAEDNAGQGAADLVALDLQPDDVVLLLSASGSTPFVLGALRAARASGALTIGFANNRATPLTQQAQIGIVLDTGSEAIAGSTRLKAGTAQKIALNTFSSALMVQLNKVYRNLMVDFKATNAKLIRRAVRLTMHASGADEASARATLEQCGYRVKVAIVALSRQVGVAQAQALLERTDGSVRQALRA